MASVERLLEIARWAHELLPEERERARAGITEREVKKGSTICHRGDRFDGWGGVVEGIIKLSTVTAQGNAITLAVLPPGAWFGEGSLLKHEPRRYDIVAVRDSRLAILDRAAFVWLTDHSTNFLRYLVTQFNERVSYYMAAVENQRSFEPTTRLAQCIAWMFNPILCPGEHRHLAISQEELGLITGVSRPMANRGLKKLEDMRFIRIERQGITVLDPAGLLSFKE